MNETDCFNKNSEKIKLIKEVIEKTGLLCLDMTDVLFGFKNRGTFNKDYYDEVEKIKVYLIEKQKEYKQALKERLIYEDEVNKLQTKLGEGIKEEFKNLEKYVNDIINNPKSKKNLFIIKKSIELIESLGINYNNKEEIKSKVNKLISYIHYRRAENIMKEYKKIIKRKKMILI